MKPFIAQELLIGFIGMAFFAGLAGAQSDATGIPTPQKAPQVGAGGVPTKEQERAGGIPLGPLTAYPSVTYQLQHNDNIVLQAPDSGLVKSDTIQVLNPSVRVEGKQGANVYGLDLGFTSGRYGDSTADNYDDNNVSANALFNPEARVRIGLRAEHLDAHDPRGSTNDPLTAEPNRYRQGTLGGIFGYGASGAQGRLEFELGGTDKHYYNNRATTAINDQDQRYGGVTFFWRIAPRTSLLAQVKRTTFDFTDPASPLDSTETRLLGGVTWEATAKTTGIFKIGQLRKDLKDSTRDDFTGGSWEGQVTWSPLTYSKWDFSTSKATRETTGGAGNFILGTTYGARWTHAWTSQFSTAASASHSIDDYKGIDRNDKIDSLGLKGTYQMRRWLSFGADYRWSKRDSNVDTSDYKNNVFMLFVSATL